jgi:hypothetical protein
VGGLRQTAVAMVVYTRWRWRTHENHIMSTWGARYVVPVLWRQRGAGGSVQVLGVHAARNVHDNHETRTSRSRFMVVMHGGHMRVVGSGRERSRQAVVARWWAQHSISSCTRTRQQAHKMLVA